MIKIIIFSSTSYYLTTIQIIIFIALKTFLLPCLFRLGRLEYQVALSSFVSSQESYLRKMQIYLKKASLPYFRLPGFNEKATLLPPPSSFERTKALNKIFIRKSSCFLLELLYVHVLCFFMALNTFSRHESSMNQRCEHKETTLLRRNSLATSRDLVLVSRGVAKNKKTVCTLALRCSFYSSFHLEQLHPGAPSFPEHLLIDKGSSFVIENVGKGRELWWKFKSNWCQHEANEFSPHVTSATSTFSNNKFMKLVC